MNHSSQIFEWAVIGAGPAGIAMVGKLLDAKINPEKILWIDPEFKVGDFGPHWRYIGSNTPVESFLKFLHRCASFGYQKDSMIEKLPPEKNCPLALTAEPLQKITQHLRQTVISKIDTVTHLKPCSDGWEIHLASQAVFITQKVLLAIGGEAKKLHFDHVAAIPLTTAMNPMKLRKIIQATDTVAVFGSAQSAKSVLGHLANIPHQKTILFYRSNTSFERHLDEQDLEGVATYKATPKNLLAHMPECTKIIFAIGFERRHIPILGLPDTYDYDQETGEIAPGIYGLGMAFPNVMHHEFGLAEYKVAALWPVMKRLDKLLPTWLAAQDKPPVNDSMPALPKTFQPSDLF